jgi:hypothetical protein
MVATQPRSNTLVLCGFALALAAVTFFLVSPGKAEAGHQDCTLSATAPSSYYGIAAITSGSVDCASSKNVLRFSIMLTRDGTLVATNERTCHKAATCWSYLVEDDSAGDQVWCTQVSARVGSHSMTAITRCEGDPAL